MFGTFTSFFRGPTLGGRLNSRLGSATAYNNLVHTHHYNLMKYVAKKKIPEIMPYRQDKGYLTQHKNIAHHHVLFEDNLEGTK